MKKYKVGVHVIKLHYVEVEATSKEKARNMAEQIAKMSPEQLEYRATGIKVLSALQVD